MPRKGEEEEEEGESEEKEEGRRRERRNKRKTKKNRRKMMKKEGEWEGDSDGLVRDCAESKWKELEDKDDWTQRFATAGPHGRPRE